MSYTLWLKIENDDGMPGDDDEGWRALAEDVSREDAVRIGDAVADLAAKHLPGVGPVAPDPLEGWYSR